MSKSASQADGSGANTGRSKRSKRNESVTQILESISDPLVVLDREWRYTYVNRAAERVAGLSREDMLGRTLWELFPPQNREFERALRRAMEERVTVPVEEYDASFETWLEATIYPCANGLTVYTQDGTERHRALREAMERYRTLFLSMDEGFCIIEMLFDESGRPVDYLILETNPAFNQQNGLKQGAGKRVSELVPGLEKWWFEVYGNVALTGEPVRLQNQVQAINRWFEVYAFRLGGRESRKVAVLFHNITEHKRAEEELQRSEERFRLLVESAEDYAIMTLDSEGRINSWSAGAERAFGYKEAEVIGRSRDLLLTPEDRERGVSGEELRQAQEKGRASYDSYCMRKDGTRFFASGVMAILHDHGAQGYVKIVRDLTRQKQIEEALRRAHEQLEQRVLERTMELWAVNKELIREIEERKRAEKELRRIEAYLAEGQRLSHTGSWVWNVSSGELYWSDEHYRIFGLDPEKTKASYPATMQWMHPEDRSFVQQSFEKAIRERSDFELDCRIVRTDGAIRHVHSLAHPVFDESGDLKEYVGTIIDTTERKRAEEILQEQMTQLRRAEEQRTQLMRQIVSAQEGERRRIAREMHDQFGQQLSALTMKLSVLKSEYGGQAPLGTQLQSLETIVKQLDADIEFLVWELRPTALDDLGLESALTNYIRSWSKHFEIQAELHANGLERGRLAGEIETVLYRVTQEALNNVAKHAQAETVAVLLHRNSSSISLIIEDDGVGFDQKQAFGTGENGLGLIGMRERTALVGGTLEIEARPDHGVTIVVRIPLRAVVNRGMPDE